MAHKHELNDGRQTGTEIIDDDPRKHHHMLDGASTSIEDFGERHTHLIDGQLTGPPIAIEGKSMETKRLGGVITKAFNEDREEGQFGIVEGYIATWDLDRGDFFGVKDQFVKGAFLASIADHLQRNRPVRFKDHHGRTVGGWIINTVHEDERGLFGRAEINLEVQRGKEAMSLIRQGVLTDFSIGFSIEEFTEDQDVRTITKATIWEGSIVDEPMNPFANVTGFKAVVPYQNLPIADRDQPWDAAKAVGRVRDLTGSEDKPSTIYKKAFVWFDKEHTDTFAGYKLQITDVIEGKLVVIPKAVFAAAADVKSVPEVDRPGLIRHLEKYYAKMDIESPFSDDDKQFYTESDIKKLTPRELERAFRKIFSKKGAKLLVSMLTLDAPPENNDNAHIEELKKLTQSIKDIKL